MDKNKKKLMWQSGIHGFFWHDLYVYYVYEHRMIEKILGFQEENIFSIYSGGVYFFYLYIDEILQNKLKLKRFYMSNQYNSYVKKIYTMLSWPRYFDIQITSDREWKNRIKNLCNMYRKVVSYYVCTESYYTDLLINDLVKKYDHDLITDLIMPDKVPSIIKEQVEWYSLCKRLQYKECFEFEFLENHLNKWRYIICSHQSEPYDLEQLIKRYNLDTCNKKIVEENLFLFERTFGEEKREKKKSRIQNFIMDDEDKEMIQRLSEIAYLRLELRQVWMQIGYLINNMIKNRYSECGSKIFEFSIDEILRNDIDFEQDRNEFIFMRINGKDKLYYNGTQKLMCEQKNIDKNIKSIIGSSSYGKPIMGKAVVIQNASERNRSIDANSILVVPQITPQIVPLIGRCKGVVTNEGGITGHASIIAREMKKSAIIGTEIGTDVIKNGDMLFLDIQNYRVRIMDDE
ncbi:PEP-utilizing enzyme [Thomasclavelia cocleata]|uniref:PEP-utilizing enzyme n=1 Tax=Thomasclavelia cocleata TaxID=69824 RepID=UPI00272EAA7C|nr:PEP-utilizing enzyme [Thomasclavelia cocleata]